MGILKRLVDTEYKELKRFKKIADEIEALDEEYTKLTDTELQNKTEEFRERLKKGETLDDILVEAFATAREAAFRIIGEKHYYVQIHLSELFQLFNLRELDKSIISCYVL